MAYKNFARRGCSPGIPKTYIINRKDRPAKTTTLSCEKCRVAAFAGVEVAVEAGDEVDDSNRLPELCVEDGAGERVGDDIEVYVEEMVPKTKVVDM